MRLSLRIVGLCAILGVVASGLVVRAGDITDLSITKVATPNPVLAGTNVTYTITVTNNGLGTASGLAVNDVIPAGTTFVSMTAPLGWALATPSVGGTGTVTATTPSLVFPGTAVLTLVVNVSAAAANGSTVSNTAVVTATNDITPANNTATAVVAVSTSADLSITKSDSPDPVLENSNVTYAIVAANAGPLAALNVAVSDVIPPNTTFVSMTTPGGWTVTAPAVGGTGTVTATLASFASGASAAMTLVVRVNPGTPSTTVISNTASIGSATPDPNSANNTATTTTTVTSAVPALTQWSLLLLALSVVAAGWLALRRRQIAL